MFFFLVKRICNITKKSPIRETKYQKKVLTAKLDFKQEFLTFQKHFLKS